MSATFQRMNPFISAAEQTFSLEIGPTLSVVLVTLLTSIGGWLTAWAALKQSRANKEKNEVTAATVDKIHTDVNSKSDKMALELKETKDALLQVSKALAVSETKKETQVIAQPAITEVKVVNTAEEKVPVDIKPK